MARHAAAGRGAAAVGRAPQASRRRAGAPDRGGGCAELPRRLLAEAAAQVWPASPCSAYGPAIAAYGIAARLRTAHGLFLVYVRGSAYAGLSDRAGGGPRYDTSMRFPPRARRPVPVPRRGRAFGRCAWRQADGRAQRSSGAGASTIWASAASTWRAQGLVSQFPLADVAVMGPPPILPRLPRIMRASTARSQLRSRPSPTPSSSSTPRVHASDRQAHPQARPTIPIIDYVSPSVWAWRPGRARKMREYVDHVMALLPFEPARTSASAGRPAPTSGIR